MILKFNYIFAIFYLIQNVLSKESIIFAFQINRHGARSPYLGVENGVDVYGEKWLQIEELSDIGRRMLYLLGVKVRKRYMIEYNLLSEKYNPQEIYIKATDTNRTIESIYCYLQGLYPNGTGEIINQKIIKYKNITYPPNVKYQKNFEEIINQFKMDDNNAALPYKMSIEPVYLFNKPLHELELYDTRYCFGHKESYEQRQKRKEILDFSDKIMNETNYMFLELEKTSNKTFLYDYWTLYKYMDGFLCDDTDLRDFDYIKQRYNISIIEQLRKYSKEFIDMDYFGTNFPENEIELGIASSSYIMRSILNLMDKAMTNYQNKKNYIKFTIISAHDSTIGAMESFLRYAFGTLLESCYFSDSRFFELYIDNNDNKYKVRYLKGDNTIKLDIDYDYFKKIIVKKTWSNEKVEEYCQINSKNEKEIDLLNFSIMLILVLINIILIIYLVLYTS